MLVLLVLTAAPERTENRRGLVGEPKVLPVSCSINCTASFTSSIKPGGRLPPAHEGEGEEEDNVGMGVGRHIMTANELPMHVMACERDRLLDCAP